MSIKDELTASEQIVLAISRAGVLDELLPYVKGGLISEGYDKRLADVPLALERWRIEKPFCFPVEPVKLTAIDELRARIKVNGR